MKKQIILDVDKCVGCGACVVACMDQHDRMFDHPEGEAPNRRIIAAEIGSYPDASIRYASVACMHCSPAPCVTACPVGCLKKDPQTDLTVFDNTDCIGCHSCAMACPFGAPSFNGKGKMEKCDGCYLRLKYGMEPACVRVCPTGALRMLTEEEYEKAHEEHSLVEEARKIAKEQI